MNEQVAIRRQSPMEYPNSSQGYENKGFLYNQEEKRPKLRSRLSSNNFLDDLDEETGEFQGQKNYKRPRTNTASQRFNM